jgi:hypothetical protein
MLAGTDTSQPHILRRRTDRATFAAIAPPAAFLGHLILGEQRAAAPRLADRASLAAGAYARGARVGIRRLPPGYRTRIDA